MSAKQEIGAAVKKRPADLELKPGHEKVMRARALSIKEVVRLTSLSRAHIYLLISEGKFPAPAKIGRRSIWDGREIEHWLEARFAERGLL